MNRIKVGIIGLGEVAQIIHLPILASMPERYEIAAICDISPKLLEVIGDKYRVNNRFLHAIDMIEQSNLDAVFVLNNMEYHTECTIAAVRRNMHVFVEKPMCATQSEVEAIIQARDASPGVHVMVGYMRRFAPAFIQALEEVKSLGPINYARVRDIIGPNGFFTSQSSHVYRFNDLPEGAVRDRKERNASLLREALGEVPDEMYGAYSLLLGLNSHDISAMRELIGMPKRVIACSSWLGGRFKNAILEFEGFNATFETGMDQQGRFDAHIEVYGEHKSVLLKYDTPYIRQLPTTLSISETNGDGYQESTIRPSYKDPYMCELEYFYEVVTQGVGPKTTPEDYMQDLIIIKMMIDVMK